MRPGTVVRYGTAWWRVEAEYQYLPPHREAGRTYAVDLRNLDGWLVAKTVDIDDIREGVRTVARLRSDAVMRLLIDEGAMTVEARDQLDRLLDAEYGPGWV